MQRFSCRVATPAGSIHTEEVVDDSPEAARRSLEAKGYFLFSVDGEEKDHTAHRLWAVGSGRIGARNLVVFNQELLTGLGLLVATIVIIAYLPMFSICPRWSASLRAIGGIFLSRGR